MSYTSFDFPNTHLYDSDLRELIRMYTQLVAEYNELVNDLHALNQWKNEHELEYQALLKRMIAIENKMDTFEAKIQAEFDKLNADITKRVDKLVSDTEDGLERIQKEFENEIALAIKEMQSQLDSMKVEIKHAIIQLENSITANNEFIFRQVEARLDDFINNLPDYENLIVYNPVRGEYTNVQLAIIDLYDNFRIYGLTASQYDSLQLTANEYDAKGLTALEYDRWAYKLLGFPDPDYYMRDPFNGRIVRTQVVIYELAELHRQALTASEYDGLELTAEQYDSLGLTAYFYDWYGIVLFENALTASEYDALGITAAEYDAKRLSAWQYDTYGKFLLTA